MIFQSIWSTYGCQGIPNALLVFNGTQTPDYYAINPIPYCGFDNFPSSSGEGCCVSSIDLYASEGYKSWLNTDMDLGWNTMNAAHKSANGHSYCKIDNTNLGRFNFTVTAYFLDNGECNYGAICSGSNLYIYQDQECTNITNSFSTLDPKIYETAVGNVSVSAFTFTNASNYVNWVTSAPGYEIVPGFSSNLERFSCVCFIASLAISFGVLVYYIWRRKVLMGIFSGICLARSIAIVAYTYTVFTSDYVLSCTTFFIDISKMYFMFGNYVTCHLLNTLWNIQYDRKRVVLFILVTVAYIGLQFLILVQDVLLLSPQLTLDAATYSALFGAAYLLDNIYTVLAFVFDSTPVLMLSIKIMLQKIIVLQKKNQDISLLELSKHYWKIFLILFMEILVGMVYLIVNYVSNTTILLGSDVAVLCTSGIYLLLQNSHYLLLILSFEYLSIYTKELVKPDKKVPEKPVEVEKSVDKTTVMDQTQKISQQ
ncbi:hypothetical protein HDV04_005414 [Boothiomyces sp. JEL0838]|nr:hypothetical protein HDV04_005414 [Boothiomyces sp. JEL0838]